MYIIPPEGTLLSLPTINNTNTADIGPSDGITLELEQLLWA
jgi:hypothetical protein